MEKFRTLNNRLCKDIIRFACNGEFRALYMVIYNSHDMMTDDLFVRVYNLCFDLAPLTLEVFKTLPFEVQSYYNQLWLNQN